MASVLNDYAKIATNVNAIRSLRTLRALRPLRAISRWKGIKVEINFFLFYTISKRFFVRSWIGKINKK